MAQQNDDEKLDPIARTILDLLVERGTGKTIGPNEAAQAVAASRAKPGDPPDLWQRYLNAVKQQALHLARQDRIVLLRKGKPLDPRGPIKGVIRWALPQDDRSEGAEEKA